VTLLLDTHAFSWFCQDDPLLSSTAKALIAEFSGPVRISADPSASARSPPDPEQASNPWLA
jgi:PIN domain nuclease of toxin-antitoxin system